jgi:hypothetical protein
MAKFKELLSGLPRITITAAQTPKMTMPLEEFELFPTLPIEIRHKIWAFVAMHPRLVK